MNKNVVSKFITGKVRLCYENLFTPFAMNESQEPKYSACFLIRKSDASTIDNYNAAIEEVQRKGEVLWGGSVPKNLKTPLRDGDVERPGQDEFAGHYFINARSNRPPAIYDKDGNVLQNSEELYSGCYVRVSLNLFAYNTAGNKGIGAGINQVMKVEDGEPLYGSSRTVNDFGIQIKNNSNDFLD